VSEHVLPFYLLCDESYSMTDHLDKMNACVRELCKAIATDRQVASKSRLCLIGFSSTANVLVPLSRLTELREITGLTATAATNYGAAFTRLREVISSDVEALNASDHVVYRPVVFVLSDGLPTDPASWRAAHDRLVDRDWPARPHIVAIGIGDADTGTLKSISTFRTYLNTGGVTAGAALRKLNEVLTSSIVLSGKSPTQCRSRANGVDRADEPGHSAVGQVAGTAGRPA